MRYDRLFTKLFCQPILLESSYRLGLELALLSLMDGKSIDPQPFARKVDEERQVKRSDQHLETRGNLAIIHVDGAIDKNLSSWDRLCFDATDLNDVDKAISRAAADSSIKNVIMAFDSPGGSFPGLPETADRIAALAKTKNVFAYCGDQACSAAYWMAAQCDQVFATASASVGSIGVYLAIIDQSRRLEDMGLNVQEVKSGSLKTAGAPWKPMTESERAHLQDRVDQIGAMFRSAVTAKRPDVSADDMQGQSMLGTAALQAGLVDGLVGSLEDVIPQFERR